MDRKYFDINEDAARRAHEMMSFSDYREGSKTSEYRSKVDEVYDLADKVAAAKPEEAARAHSLAERYAQRMATNMNRDSEIGCRCPSVMIAGPSNFPTQKKEKQVAAWNTNMEDYREIEKIPGKIKDLLYHTQPILAADDDAIAKLERKLEILKQNQQVMKNVNAWYRKMKTLDGCPSLTREQIEELKASMELDWRQDPKPFEAWQLSNNNANIHSVEKRLQALRQEKEKETTETEGKHFRVVENKELMRLQLFFDDKPEPEVRDVLKGNGFRWAPSQKAWQRQLTDNARFALRRVEAALDEMERQATEPC